MTTVLCDNLVELIRELSRTEKTLPPPNTKLLKQIKEELEGVENTPDTHPSTIYANALNKRLRLLYRTYLSERIQRIEQIRMEIGSTIPNSVIINMTSDEVKYYKSYCKSISEFEVDQNIDILFDTDKPQVLETVNVIANQTKSMGELSDNASIYTTNGLIKLNSKEVQCVVRTPTVDNLIHLGVLSVVN